MTEEASVVSKESWEEDEESEDGAKSSRASSVKLWSLCLTSPDGTRLQQTCSRAKQLSRSSRKYVLLLLETAQFFDAYAHDTFKASQTLNSITDTAVPVPALQLLAAKPSEAYSQMAKRIKSISLSLQRFLGTYDDATNSLFQSYQGSRRAAVKAREKALNAQSVYISIHGEAAAALGNRVNECRGESSDRILPKLAQLQACESRYKTLVQMENEYVRQRQRLEAMALESMQKLEEDRFVICQHSFNKLLTSVTETSDMVAKKLHTDIDLLDFTTEKKAGRRALRNHSFGAIIMTVNEEEGNGSIDAEMFGLPMEIGQLRDQVSSLAALRANTVQTARALAAFLDSVIAATTKLVTAQQQTNSFESVREAMVTAGEGERVVEMWSSLTKTLKKEAADALVFAEQLKSLRCDKLNHILEYGDNVLKPSSERDNATWKQLCDAARSQANAEARHTEANAQHTRVRDRCKPAESVSAVWSSIGIATSKNVSESLASMFSVLPNGREHAMKVLDPSTRVSMAQHIIEEADQKEAKERQLLDSAMELTGLSLEAYRSSADSLRTLCENNEPDDFGQMLASFSAHVASFDEARQSSLGCFQDLLVPLVWHEVTSYMNTWSSTTQYGFKAGHEVVAPDESGLTEPMLSIQLEQSELVRNALSSLISQPSILPDAADGIIDEETECEAHDDMPIGLPTTPLRERAASAASLSSVASRSPGDETAASWLLRSLTTMPDTDSIFGKISLAKKEPRMRQPEFDAVDTETSIFSTYFWPEHLDSKSIPSIVDSFACSFRVGAQRFPFQYGRVFITNVRLIFVGWTRKQLSLQWDAVVAVEPVANSLSAQNDSFVIKCRKNGLAEESFMVLSGFYDRRRASDVIENVRNLMRASSSELSTVQSDVVTPPSTPGRPQNVVMVDEPLRKMVGIVSGNLRSLSIQRFYDVVWSEGNGNDEKAFYRPWLEKECFDVDVGPWHKRKVTGPWCKEHYTQTREVKFKVQRKTHLYIGPPIANVTQVRSIDCRLALVFIVSFLILRR